MGIANKLTDKASKNRKDPFEFSFNELEHMALELGLPEYEVKTIPGAHLRKGNGFKSDVWLVPAHNLYDFLIKAGHRRVLEESGIINHEVLVAQFGAW